MYQNESKPGNIFQNLSIPTSTYQYLAISVNIYQFLSISMYISIYTSSHLFIYPSVLVSIYISPNLMRVVRCRGFRLVMVCFFRVTYLDHYFSKKMFKNILTAKNAKKKHNMRVCHWHLTSTADRPRWL